MKLLLPTVAMLALLAGCDRDREQRPRSQPIQIGQTVEGRLDEGDWTDVFADRSYTDLYEIRLESGQSITVELSSDDFDAYLSILRGPGDQLVDNDDIEPGNTDSRLTYEAQAMTRVFIAATTLRAGETGSYRLVVREGATEPPTKTAAPASPSPAPRPEKSAEDAPTSADE